MGWRIHAVGMAVECPLVAKSGLFRAVRRTSAIPPKADITAGELRRSPKADIQCPLYPRKQTWQR
jgi:hypothetical protein